MSDDEKISDYTKTKRYASIDLASKVISAVALVALGVAGSMFQWRTESARQATEKLERQERKYLPMLRSLSVLELELESLSKKYLSQSPEENRKHPSYDWEQASYDNGTELRFVAESVFVPDGDPTVLLRPPDTIARRGQGYEQISLPLKASAIMYAELMRMKLLYKDRPERSALVLDPQGRFFVMKVGDEMTTSHFYFPPESLPAWQLWLKSEPLDLSKVHSFNMELLLQDLRFATSGAIHEVLSNNIDLGDRYVQIRDELEKSRQSNTIHNTESNNPAP